MSLLSRSPIGAAEFGRALHRAYKLPNSSFPSNPPLKLGLALSGGVDSTALAYLCQSIQSSKDTKESILELYGFIVDHGFRPDSTQEAREAARHLGDILGRKPSILTLKWPPGVNPTEPKQFETRARVLRLQALGSACRRHGIQSLLFAHHEDDNHELMLLRLQQKSRAPGLCGMQPATDILECNGMHGVAASGSFVPSPISTRDPVQGFEQGGIRILRPLLQFSKARLIATCEAAKLPWHEDPTNADVRLTGRNAIRNMIAQDMLPRALRKSALLRTMRICNSKMEDVAALSEQLYRACIINVFDIHVGCLTLQVPRPEVVFGERFKEEWTLGLKIMVLSGFLRMLAQLVAPRNDLQTRSFRHGVAVLFGWGTLDHRSDSFSAEKVTFKRAQSQGPSKYFEQWVVHREPQGPEVRLSKSIKVRPGSTTEFRLWDARYWVRVKKGPRHAIMLEATTRGTLNSFEKLLPLRQQIHLHKILRLVAPNMSRDTILSIQLPKGTPGARGNRILSLPTLGISLPGYKDKFEVEVRYKRVDLFQGFKPMRLAGSYESDLLSHLIRQSSMKHDGLYSYRRDSSLFSRIGPGRGRNLMLPANKTLSSWKDVHFEKFKSSHETLGDRPQAPSQLALTRPLSTRPPSDSPDLGEVKPRLPASKSPPLLAGRSRLRPSKQAPETTPAFGSTVTWESNLRKAVSKRLSKRLSMRQAIAERLSESPPALGTSITWEDNFRPNASK